jgi:hypothetical protein
VGLDLHPVAVALARVTYLLAIGRERLVNESRGPIAVPVYLGDSVQWSQQIDLFSDGQLLIPTGQGETLFEDELRFPDHLLEDAARFDRLIEDMATLAGKARPKGDVPSLTALFKRLAVSPQDQSAIRETFGVLCRLHEEGRNHIWSYYIRNLARPVWLSRSENRADVLIGNPPWLSYRNMPSDMQAVFHAMSDAKGLWHGKTVATHQDLSGLFVVRAVEQYLSVGGTFAFVMPNAALDRGYFKGFRSGKYPDPAELITVAFTSSWDLRRLRPHFFPRGAAVVFGERTSNKVQALPLETDRWTGKIPRTAHTWAEVQSSITRQSATLRVSSDDAGDESPYGARFSAGATIYPHYMFFVEPQPATSLGVGAGRRAIQSARSSNEKPPWKQLPSMTGVVEAEFVWPVLLGENVLPYRILPSREAVLPLEGKELLDGEHPHIDLYPGLAEWWRQAEQHWHENRSSERLTLVQRLNFRQGLTDQLPVSPLRVVYGASGMHVVAALVENSNAVTEHKLYWGAVESRAEGNYLCAILNCPELTRLVRPMMSYGKDERDVDKHVWDLPIPSYNPKNPLHVRLSELGHQEEILIANLDLNEKANFVTLRQEARDALAATNFALEIDTIVTELIG